jgi:hypothetical protein
MKDSSDSIIEIEKSRHFVIFFSESGVRIFQVEPVESADLAEEGVGPGREVRRGSALLILRRRRRRGPAAWLLLPSLSYSRVRETDLVTCQPLVRNNPARSVRARPPSSEVPSSKGAPRHRCTSLGAN